MCFKCVWFEFLQWVFKIAFSTQISRRQICLYFPSLLHLKWILILYGGHPSIQPQTCTCPFFWSRFKELTQLFPTGWYPPLIAALESTAEYILPYRCCRSLVLSGWLTEPAGWVHGNQAPVLALSRTTETHLGFLQLPGPSCLLKVETVLQCWAKELLEVSWRCFETICTLWNFLSFVSSRKQKANILCTFVFQNRPVSISRPPSRLFSVEDEWPQAIPTEFTYPKIFLLPMCRVTFHLEVRRETSRRPTQ